MRWYCEYREMRRLYSTNVIVGLMKTQLRLLHPDPKSRATLTDLDNDPWVNQIVNINKYSFSAVVKGGAACYRSNPVHCIACYDD